MYHRELAMAVATPLRAPNQKERTAPWPSYGGESGRRVLRRRTTGVRSLGSVL